MKLLKTKHPAIHAEFKKGKFVFNKTCRSFSSLAIDHNHEQHNAVLKGDGGVIGKFDNENALLRWMVAGPEIAAMIGDFEEEFQLHSEVESHLHHEQSESFQFNFVKDVKSLISCFKDNMNPFSEDCTHLTTLKSRVIIGPSGDNSVMQAKLVGVQRYAEFVKEGLVEKKISIFDTIPQNHFTFFKDVAQKKKATNSEQVKGLRNDLKLVTKLFLTSQTRPSDLNEFYKFENQPCPPALSANGALRSGKKSDILECFQKCYVVNNLLTKPETTCSVLDGQSIVNMVRPGEAKTFREYAIDRFKSYIQNHYCDQLRVDVLFDIYIANSLKASVREKRGEGRLQLVKSNVKLPLSWSKFLRIDQNKRELFKFLGNEIVESSGHSNQVLICTTEDTAISNMEIDLSSISPCDHEESDSRIMVHVSDAVNNGHQKVSIQTVDSDVVAIAVRCFIELGRLSELWIAFGTGKDFR